MVRFPVALDIIAWTWNGYDTDLYARIDPAHRCGGCIGIGRVLLRRKLTVRKESVIPVDALIAEFKPTAHMIWPRGVPTHRASSPMDALPSSAGED